jgi:transcriptional regulator with XRE-family HTH domain
MRVVELIEAVGLNDREIGARIGVSQQSVNRWRRGEQVPGVERAEALATVLCTTEDAVLSAIVSDLKGRSLGDSGSGTAEVLLSAACSIVRATGPGALTLRAVAEHCGTSITAVASRWRTRDDLTKATLNFALATAGPDTVEAVVRSHLEQLRTIDPGVVREMPGMVNAMNVAGGRDSLLLLIGAAVLDLPAAG